MNTINHKIDLPGLFRSLTSDDLVDRLLKIAAEEDLDGNGDITSKAMYSSEHVGQGIIIARQDGIVSGLAAWPNVCDAFQAKVNADIHLNDGNNVSAGDTVATVTGSMRELLTVERTFLNLLGRLSGIATLTGRFVDAVKSTHVQIVDTRKTTPGLRRLEKYAVACGGGVNHRLGLYDAALIKDNHLAGLSPKQAADKLRKALAYCRSEETVRFVQVEVDNLEQLDAVFALGKNGPDIILLDNMPPDILQEAVRRRDAMQPGILLEASGGITLETVRTVAETGVDRISVGAITHSAVQLDFGLDID